MAKIRYEGRCHCGRIRFAFRSEPITNAKRCNCSICKRKGAVVSAKYFPAEDFEPHEDFGAKRRSLRSASAARPRRGKKDMSQLEDYRWGDRDVNHLFCKTCGIYPYHGDSKMGYRVNLGCVDDIDVFALEIGLIDGKAM